MAIIVIDEKNKKRKYFMGYDEKTGKPKFTTVKEKAYRRPDGYYVKSELEQLTFYFKDEFPELENAFTEDD